jgi:hypothetical protein
MSNDKIPVAIKMYFIENYVSVLKTLEQAYDANMSLILLTPLMEALASASGKSLLKSLEETFMSLRSVTLDEVCFESNEKDEGQDKEDEEGSAVEPEETMFDLSFVGPSLFEIGADSEVASPNRKILYQLSKSLEDLANLEGFESEHCCEGDCHDHEAMEEDEEESTDSDEEQ